MCPGTACRSSAASGEEPDRHPDPGLLAERVTGLLRVRRVRGVSTWVPSRAWTATSTPVSPQSIARSANGVTDSASTCR